MCSHRFKRNIHTGRAKFAMNTIYAKYNMYHNSIDIYTSAGYMLRIDCNKAEDGLKATPRSQYSLYALAAFQWGSGINNLSSDYFFNL